MFFSAIESPLLIAGFFIQLTVKKLRAILDKVSAISIFCTIFFCTKRGAYISWCKNTPPYKGGYVYFALT